MLANIWPAQVVKSSDGATGTDVALLCTKCRSLLGHAGPSSDSLQLRKSHLSLSISPSHSSISYDVEKWFAGLVLSAMDSQGSRKFTAEQVKYESEDDGKALKLWVFAPDLLISSSRKSSADYIRVCKIMWQDCEPTSESASDPLTASVLSEGEIRLQRDELASLRNILQRSNLILPEDAREFQGWQVALLERFTVKDLQ